jgi:hypothetical protein
MADCQDDVFDPRGHLVLAKRPVLRHPSTSRRTNRMATLPFLVLGGEYAAARVFKAGGWSGSRQATYGARAAGWADTPNWPAYEHRRE